MYKSINEFIPIINSDTKPTLTLIISLIQNTKLLCWNKQNTFQLKIYLIYFSGFIYASLFQHKLKNQQWETHYIYKVCTYNT